MAARNGARLGDLGRLRIRGALVSALALALWLGLWMRLLVLLSVFEVCLWVWEVLKRSATGLLVLMVVGCRVGMMGRSLRSRWKQGLGQDMLMRKLLGLFPEWYGAGVTRFVEVRRCWWSA